MWYCFRDIFFLFAPASAADACPHGTLSTFRDGVAQAEVAAAHEEHICSPSFLSECGGVAVSLERYRWAVGAVESRAFGIRVRASTQRSGNAPLS
jgi:hypothetical protein